MSEHTILSVSTLNKYIKSTLEAEDFFRSVWVRGELSNFTHHKSGHMYMTLKDEGSLIKTIMFKSSADKLKFEPESGMKVIVHGRVSVFERDGQYQLYIDDMIADGIGSLTMAYEQLKEELRLAGLFDENNKKPLPKYPSKIGVVTSPTGAAIRDMINILGRRYPLAEVILFPALVQGEGAPADLIEGIDYFNKRDDIDVIIIGRGGGSIEDLWGFNSKELAYTIYNSSIPIVSAVGHETDFTIADFVADLRAPTPSAAAELVVPNSFDLIVGIANVKKLLIKDIKKKYDISVEKLKDLSSRKCMTDMMFQVDYRRQLLDGNIKRLSSSMTILVANSKEKLSQEAAALDALSPLAVLSRGYSITQINGKSVQSVNDVNVNDNMDITLIDGKLKCSVLEKRRLEDE